MVLLFAVCIHPIMYCLSKFILKIPHKHTMILYKFSLRIHNKTPQQRAGYHLVLIGLLSRVWPKLTNVLIYELRVAHVQSVNSKTFWKIYCTTYK
jgi:hypothetical protein